VSYRTHPWQALKYAWYDGCAWQISTVDSWLGEDVGYTSLAVLPSGQPAISYYDDTNEDLKYAWRDGNAWHTTIVDNIGAVGYSSSLAILPSGQPVISYFDSYPNYDLKYAKLIGSDPCNPEHWQKFIVDSNGIVGYGSSLTILPSGHPAISYGDQTNFDLRYAWYDGTTWQKITVDNDAWPSSTSMAILPSGYPAIGYGTYNGYIKYAWYDGGAWNTTTVDASSGGTECDLAVLPSGHPVMSYYDSYDGDMKYAWYDGVVWQITTVDSSGGFDSSLVILESGYPAISYTSYSYSGLNFATPANTPVAPVEVNATYTSIARTDLGGITTVINGPAFNSGYGTGDDPPYESSSVRLEITERGHLRGIIKLIGTPGTTHHPDGPWPIPCGDANGTISGTLILGTSSVYPLGSDLRLSLEIIAGGWPSELYEDYHMMILNDTQIIAQIDPCTPSLIIVPVLAGEAIRFELFALEKGGFLPPAYWQPVSYYRSFEFRMILHGPANFNGKGSVDFRDYGFFAQHWLYSDCNEPEWCGKADLDKNGIVDWTDMKKFTEHWLE
jgi:hypothetical protein